MTKNIENLRLKIIIGTIRSFSANIIAFICMGIGLLHEDIDTSNFNFAIAVIWIIFAVISQVLTSRLETELEELTNEKL